jgi:hypothetical protein
MKQFDNVPLEFDEQYKEFINKLTQTEYLKFERERFDLVKQLERIYEKYNQIVSDRESKNNTKKDILEFVKTSNTEPQLQLILDTLIFGYQHNLEFFEMFRFIEQTINIKNFKVNKEVLMDMPESKEDKVSKEQYLIMLKERCNK